jgi:hypothetical protein
MVHINDFPLLGDAQVALGILSSCVHRKGEKNPIKIDGRNHHTEDKSEGQRKVKRCAACKTNQKREKACPSCGMKYFSWMSGLSFFNK